jgi:hypothetical protein
MMRGTQHGSLLFAFTVAGMIYLLRWLLGWS